MQIPSPGTLVDKPVTITRTGLMKATLTFRGRSANRLTCLTVDKGSTISPPSKA
jgi:hypothetical protein